MEPASRARDRYFQYAPSALETLTPMVELPGHWTRTLMAAAVLDFQ